MIGKYIAISINKNINYEFNYYKKREKVMKSLEDEILEFIEKIRDKMASMKLDAVDVFYNGNCGNLYQLLAKRFSQHHAVIPHLIIYREVPQHIVSEIEGKLYDITGETSLEKYIQYVKEHNYGKFEDKDFSIKPLVVPKDRMYYTSKMADMYRYNDEYEQSEISNQMYQLKKYLEAEQQEK